MSKLHRAVALLALFAVAATSLVAASTTVEALPPQPITTVPPIIGNTTSGILRDVPAQYYAAIDTFEDNAIREVLETHNLPLSDYEAVKAWGRDAVRTQEFLDLMAIIKTPAALRTPNEALVHEWFQGLYHDQQVAQAQAAVDQYLAWSGLTMDTITLDPIPLEPTGTGYCSFRPPTALDSGIGLFEGTYDPSQLIQCNGPGGEAQCAGLATGCPVPWPSVQQFQQWGVYVAQQEMLDDPIFMNQALEISTGVGLAATMAATGVGTALARSYLAVPVGSTNFLSKIFPYAARVTFDTAKSAAEITKTAVRVGGAVRVGAAAFVAGTVITAIVTIVLESLTIAEHMAIPITLRDALAKAQADVPDLAAVADSEGGPGALMTTFISTTAIDVDPDCVLPIEGFSDYSKYPCANAQLPPAATPADDLFYVTSDETGVATGELRPAIYTVNPLNSVPGATSNESVRLSGNGWFVATKYDGTRFENEHEPQIAGATSQNIRLYFRDWNGKPVAAERIQDADGHPMFALTVLDPEYVGPCSTLPTAGAISTCVTDTIQYLEPDGTKASAQVVSSIDIRPEVDVVIPDHTVAGVPITLSANAVSVFGIGPFTYRWTVPGATLEGATVTTPIRLAGTVQVRLDVIDSFGLTNTYLYPVLVAQNTEVGVGIWPRSPAAHGSAPQVWAEIVPIRQQGVQCTWNQTSGEIGCVNPTGAVQFFVDGAPAGDPVAVNPTYSPPCLNSGGQDGCIVSIGENHVWAPAIVLTLTAAPGTQHTVTATYLGDDKYVGATGSATLDVIAATPDVALTSGTTYPSPTQPVTLTATVRHKPGSAGMPTGTVRLLPIGSTTPLGPAVSVDSSGNATLNITTLAAVTGLVVSYSGDVNFAATDSTSYPITFSQQPSSATVDVAASTVLAGTAVELTVAILDDQGDPVPGASVSVSPGDVTGTTAEDGTATLTVTSALPGTVTYTVSANGIPDLGSTTITYGTAAGVSGTAVTGEVGRPLSIPVSASGEPAPTVTVTGLPAGLSFDAATSTVTGTPTAPGTTAATATASNALGSASGTITIIVLGAPAISTSSLPNATTGTAYQADVAVTGGQAPFQYAATGLPAGLSIDAATGRISGTPTTAGTATVTLGVTDLLGGVATRSLSLSVGAAAPAKPDLAVTMTAGPFKTGAPATYTITVANVATPSVSGPIVVADTLPSGVKFTSASGSGWACGALLRTVLCARAGGLSAGQTTSLVLKVTVNAKSGTVLTNSATAAAATQEPNRTNNTASVTTTVTR